MQYQSAFRNKRSTQEVGVGSPSFVPVPIVRSAGIGIVHQPSRELKDRWDVVGAEDPGCGLRRDDSDGFLDRASVVRAAIIVSTGIVLFGFRD